LFSDLDLARRLERTEAHAGARFVEARAKVFPQSGARWIEVAGTYAMYDGATSAATQTFGLGLSETFTSGDLDSIEGFFKSLDAPVFHEVSPLAGLSIMDLLIDRGYRPVELTSVMFREISTNMDPLTPRSNRIRVRLIGENEHDQWANTMSEGWSDIADLSGLFAEMGKVRACTQDAFSFLAELDGKPIAAGGLNICEDVALLAGACTISEGRNKGAQFALLDDRLRYAASKGCNLAMVCAAPGGRSQRNAERNGFRIAYTRIKWRLSKETE
jgi:GNAT superfamily N-acetyltransferase